MSAKDKLIGQKFPVLDHGYVILRDVMGSDEEIVRAARISYGEGTKHSSNDPVLIDYLMRHGHTSPFEMGVLRFQVKLPIFVERQWVRHRTCSMNEMSGRYSVMPDESYVPNSEVVRAQSKSNKQGREAGLPEDVIKGFINTCNEQAYEAFTQYNTYLQEDVARELARINLPLSTYTEKVWQMNLHNLFHFLKLRTDEHAQWEIRQYAEVIEKIVAELFPFSYSSWIDNVKYAVKFSDWEMFYIKDCLDIKTLTENLKGRKDRKTREFREKLGIPEPEEKV